MLTTCKPSRFHHPKLVDIQVVQFSDYFFAVGWFEMNGQNIHALMFQLRQLCSQGRRS